MKIKYAFMNGDTTEVEVDDAIGTMILESRKKEESLSRKERYHCYSYDAALYEGNEYGRDAVEDILFPNDRYREIKATLLELEPTQRRRLLLFMSGKSAREIAKAEGVSNVAVSKSINAAKKHFEKFKKQG